MQKTIEQAIHCAIRQWAETKRERCRFEFTEIRIPENRLAWIAREVVSRPYEVIARPMKIHVNATRRMILQDGSAVIDHVLIRMKVCLDMTNGTVWAAVTWNPERTIAGRNIWLHQAKQVTREYPPPDLRGELAGKLITMIQEHEELYPYQGFVERMLRIERDLHRLALNVDTWQTQSMQIVKERDYETEDLAAMP